MYHVLLLNSEKNPPHFMSYRCQPNRLPTSRGSTSMAYLSEMDQLSVSLIFSITTEKYKNNRARVVINVAIKWEGKTDQLEGGK